MKIVEFKDYDNQTTPLSAYNLNRLQQNLITTKYQMTFSSAVSGGSTITLPCYYQVGQDTLDVYLNSELLKKASTKDSEGHYYEVGNSDTKSNQIKITSDWSIASGDVLNLIVRGTTDSYDQNLSPDKATQLADEISANKEEITALQTENSRLIRPKVANQQKVIDQLPQVTGQGTSITLKNTIEAQFTKFEIEGNSTQDGTPSPETEIPIYSAGDNENLFDKDNANILNGYINGTTKTYQELPTAKSCYISIKPNTTYTISKISSRRFVLATFNTEIINETTATIIGIPKNTDTSYTITTGGNDKYLVVFYYLSTADTLSEETIRNSIQIEQGTVATPYSPYGMRSITEKIANRNLVEKNIKGYINISGFMSIDNASESFVFWAEQGKTYNYSCLKSTNRGRCAKSETINIVNGTPLTNIRNVSNSFTSNFTGWCVLFVNSFLDNEIKDSFMIEQGSTATDYIPHEEQTYTIPTQQPMRSIGDVRDVFFKNTVDSPYYDENLVENGWYERHPIHRLILTGDEEWNMLPTSLFQLPNIPVSIARSGGLCNRYRYNSSQSNLNNTLRYGEFAIQVLANGTYLYFKNTDFTDTESFKADLKAKYEAGTPVYVDYLLAGPLNLPCTQAQIDVLENMPSTYKEMTIINSEDETPAYLEVSGIYDLNSLINNFIRKEI